MIFLTQDERLARLEKTFAAAGIHAVDEDPDECTCWVAERDLNK